MSTHSTDGREWAKLSELKPRQQVEIDDGFTCMGPPLRKGVKRKAVKQGPLGLYLDCQDGGHYLDGQADDGEHCVGVWPVKRALTAP